MLRRHGVGGEREQTVAVVENQEAERSSAVTWTVDAIRERVAGGEYAAGQRLIEADLTSELGVSRSTVREAFRLLAAQGILQLVHNRGALVQRMSRSEVEQLYAIREVLEGLAASLAARAVRTRRSPAPLLARLQAMARYKGSADSAAYFKENRAFHAAVVAMSENEQLAKLIDQLQLPLLSMQFRSQLSTLDIGHSIAAHEAIAEAILAGDEERAGAEMRAHVRTGGLIVARHPDGFFRRSAG